MRRVFIWGAIFVSLVVALQEFEDYIEKHRTNPTVRRMYAATISPIRNGVREIQAIEKARTPVEAAEAYLKAHREEWKLQPYHEFRPVEFKSPLGTKVKFSVFQEGIPVLDLEIQIQVESDLTIGSVENKYLPVEKADLKDLGMSSEEVIRLVPDRYSLTQDPSKLFSPVLVVPPASKIPQLAYLVPVRDSFKKNEALEVLFRSTDGQVLGVNRARGEF